MNLIKANQFNMTDSAYSLTSNEWSQILLQKGQSLHVLPYWLDGLYKNRDLWNKHIGPRFKEEMSSLVNWDLPRISLLQKSHDGTAKFQLRLGDQLEVETVLIPFHKRMTICVSTQVGCGMNCQFCYTGTQGLKRNLTTGEIVGQYLLARSFLLEKSPNSPTPSLVFMGQGEPFHNRENVLKAIQILNDPAMIGVGLRQITLSTVGYLPGMNNLENFPKVNVALSLHSPFDDERSQLIPVNQKYPLTDIMKSLDKLRLLNKQFVTYEYLLIKDFNMSKRHADELQKLLAGRKAIINLIPFNPYPGSRFERPSDEEIEEFKKMLVSRKLRVMVRSTKGQDILAACGQLKIQGMGKNNGTA